MTIFVARKREKAWRWLAYVVPVVVIDVMIMPDLGNLDDVWSYVALIVVWTLIGSALGASIATRLVQGPLTIHKDDE